MSLPGFGAELSAYRSTGNYVVMAAGAAAMRGVPVTPQQMSPLVPLNHSWQSNLARLGLFGDLRPERAFALPEQLCRCECTSSFHVCWYECVLQQIDEGYITTEAMYRCRAGAYDPAYPGTACFRRRDECYEQCNPRTLNP